MECPNCHAGNAEGAGYCSSCGTSLTSASAQVNPNFGLAGRGDRFLAAIVDGVIYLVPYILIFAFDPVIGGLLLLAVFVYQIVLLTKDGQTVGKKAWGIRIVRMQTGANGGFVTNALLRLIPLYGLVDILFIFRSDRRCIHDMIAGTQVVEAETFYGP